MTREKLLEIIKIAYSINASYTLKPDAMPEVIKALEEDRKEGHWIGTEYDGYADGNPVYDTWECSECGWEHNGTGDTLTCYCPNCGARMVEPQESEDKE